MSHLQMLLLLSLDTEGHVSKQQCDVVHSGNLSSERASFWFSLFRRESICSARPALLEA